MPNKETMINQYLGFQKDYYSRVERGLYLGSNWTIRACMRAACVQKVLILQIFNWLFLPAAASLGYQTFYRFSGRWVLPGCGQLVPVLRQVRAWSTSEGPVCQHGFHTNAASHDSHGSTKACSRSLLPKRRSPMGMLQHVSEIATDVFLPSKLIEVRCVEDKISSQ